MFKIFGADARKAHPFLMSLAESFRNRKKSAIELDRLILYVGRSLRHGNICLSDFLWDKVYCLTKLNFNLCMCVCVCVCVCVCACVCVCVWGGVWLSFLFRYIFTCH